MAQQDPSPHHKRSGMQLPDDKIVSLGHVVRSAEPTTIHRHTQIAADPFMERGLDADIPSSIPSVPQIARRDYAA
jgi:hypothetical protein